MWKVNQPRKSLVQIGVCILKGARRSMSKCPASIRGKRERDVKNWSEK
jgi:hypothetical protein